MRFSGKRIEDEEVLELGDDLLRVGLGKVGVEKGLGEVFKQVHLILDLEKLFFLAIHDSGEQDPHDIDSINEKKLHDFADDFGVGEFIEQKGFVVVDEQFHEIHFQGLQFGEKFGHLDFHLFRQKVDLLVKLWSPREVHVSELFREKQVLEMGLDCGVGSWALLLGL